MARRGRPSKYPERVSGDCIREAMAASYLWLRARPHFRPGHLERFVAEESARTGICRTKIFEIIRKITLQRATGVIRLSGQRATHKKKS